MEPLREMLVELIRVAATRLPIDVYEALRRAYAAEEEPLAREMLAALLRNAELAARLGRPICQDTGYPWLLLRVGVDSPYRHRVYEAAGEAVEEATRLVPLRPNTLDPWSGRVYPNRGPGAPEVEVELVPGDRIEAVYMPKGGGSEAVTRVRVAAPLEAPRALAETVVTAVAEAGPRACPPLVVGVGVAASGAQALALARRALLRPLGSRNPRREAAEAEKVLLEAVNMLGIGPHGVGGSTTALAVHLEYAARHPATYAVGVAASCWALRRASGVLEGDGSWRLTSRHLPLQG